MRFQNFHFHYTLYVNFKIKFRYICIMKPVNENTLTIGFDGKRAVSNNTGLGNYSRLILESLAEKFPNFLLNIYSPKDKQSDRLNRIRNFNNAKIITPSQKPLVGSLWRSYGITKQLQEDKIDIYHGLSNELPLNIRKSGIPTIVTIHDVIYRKLPYCYSAIDRKIYDWKYGRSCHLADRIIAVSQCTKNDIVEAYGIDPEKIDVVYQGCDKQFKIGIHPDKVADVRDKYKLPKEYVIQVGTVERRKNLELIVRALSALPDNIELVAIGRDRGYRKFLNSLAQQLGVSKRIYYLENVPFSDFPALYKGAAVAVYPSRYEGFGIPILESISCGTPTIGATGSCLEEAGGEGAIYVNPDNPRQLSEAINSILNDDIFSKELINKGLIHASKFDISSIAENMVKAYAKVLGRDL